MAIERWIVLDGGETLSTAEFQTEIRRLTREIRWHEQQAQANARTAVEHKREIGLRLIRVRDLLDHGEFLPWTKKEFGWGHSHVYRHIELATNFPRVGSLATDVSWRQINKALKGEAPAPAPQSTDGDEDEPDAMFWAARDGLLALRDAAQGQANRFGVKRHPENLTLSDIKDLVGRVQVAAQAVQRVQAILDGVPEGRMARRPASGRGPAPLGAQHQAIVAALHEHGSQTSKELSPRTGIPVYILSGRLTELARLGMILRTGEKRGGAFEYRVAEVAP